MMRKFLLWDHDGVLVDTERWYFAATKESLGRLDVQLDQPTYLRFMAKGRSCWDLAVQRGLSESSISEAKLERDRRYQELLLKEKIEIEGVIEVLFVINIEDCSQAKPAAEPYLRALERFGATPAEALAIEDSSRGLTSAVSAGVDCAIIRNDFTGAQDFTGAWCVLDSVRALPTALERRPRE